MRRLAALTLLLLLLPGCALVARLLGGGFERPELRFVEARPGGWSLEGVQLELVYDVENPNARELDVTRVRYQLDVEGQRVFDGEPEGGIRLAASDTTRITLPARVRFADVLPAASAILGKDSLAWRVSGSLGIDTPIGLLDYPLSRSGRIAVPDPAELAR